MERNTNKLWWTVLGGLVGVIVILVVAIVVVKSQERGAGGGEGEIPMEDVEVAYDVNDAAYDIVYKFENDPEFTEGDAEQAFGELIEKADGNGRIYATVAYANFLYDQTRDIERAATLMTTIEEEVPDDLKSGFYMSFSGLYKKAGVDSEADRYYILATELSKEYGGL